MLKHYRKPHVARAEPGVGHMDCNMVFITSETYLRTKKVEVVCYCQQVALTFVITVALKDIVSSFSLEL